MGASGSGKTSLLNILSDRISKERGTKITGKVLINDTRPLKQEIFGTIAGYVMQDDILFMHFTPRQALTFAARLKLHGVSRQDQDQKVEVLLKDLDLNQAADTLIGSHEPNKFISGGERKLTAIGVELIAEPSLLLLDEPTSGINSFRALHIVKLLQKQAKQNGMTIISTIHQPSSQAFSHFDRLILMCDGYIVYQGKASECLHYFEEIRFPLKPFTNPADEYLKYTSLSYPINQNDEQKLFYFIYCYAKYLKFPNELEARRAKYPAVTSDQVSIKNASVYREVEELLYRNCQGLKHDHRQLIQRLIQTVLQGLFCLAIFFDLKGNSFSSQINLSGALFFICLIQITNSFMATITVFQDERPVFMREQANRMYRVFSYFIAKTSIEIPLTLMLPLIFAILTYFGIGLTISAHQFWVAYGSYILLHYSGTSYGLLLSSFFRSETTAAQVAPIIIVPLILFSGYVSNLSQLSERISWIQWFSPVRYVFETLIYNEFGTRDYQEGDVNMVEFFKFELGVWKCLLTLFGFATIQRIIAIVILKFTVRKFKK